MNSNICDAIENQYVIEFYYEGELRIVEPHCYGLSSKGNEIVRGYQIGGYSSSGKMGWKLYDLSKITGLTVTFNTFHAETGYKPGDSAMSTIFCEL